MASQATIFALAVILAVLLALGASAPPKDPSLETSAESGVNKRPVIAQNKASSSSSTTTTNSPPKARLDKNAGSKGNSTSSQGTKHRQTRGTPTNANPISVGGGHGANAKASGSQPSADSNQKSLPKQTGVGTASSVGGGKQQDRVVRETSRSNRSDTDEGSQHKTAVASGATKPPAKKPDSASGSNPIPHGSVVRSTVVASPSAGIKQPSSSGNGGGSSPQSAGSEGSNTSAGSGGKGSGVSKPRAARGVKNSGEEEDTELRTDEKSKPEGSSSDVSQSSSSSSHFIPSTHPLFANRQTSNITDALRPKLRSTPLRVDPSKDTPEAEDGEDEDSKEKKKQPHSQHSVLKSSSTSSFSGNPEHQEDDSSVSILSPGPVIIGSSNDKHTNRRASNSTALVKGLASGLNHSKKQQSEDEESF